MEPISRDKHTRAQGRNQLKGKAVSVALSVLLLLGFAPTIGDEAFAASEVPEGDIVRSAEENASSNEGPENSFRYVDGVLVDPEQGDSLGTTARASGLVSTPTWNSTLGYNKYIYYNAKGVAIEHEVQDATAVGIDVSEHQGLIDWAKVKSSGVSFAILRVGYGSDFATQDDRYFAANVDGALQNGIAIGVYLYSYATKASGGTGSAESEAQHVLRVLKSKGLSPSSLALPVYLDMEQDKQGVFDQGDLSPAELGDIAEKFCSIVSAAGYRVGVYSNPTWWETKLTSPKFENPSWSKWVAQWGNYDRPQVDFDYGLWQFTSHGVVEGISGYADMNFSTGGFYGQKDSWDKANGYWYYYGSDGVPLKGYHAIGGKWYCFNNAGRMLTGWAKHSDGSWSWHNASGAAATGWKQLGGSWYYLDPATGVAAVGSKSIGGKIYYFNSSCQMLTGWAKHADGSWSWHNASGAAATGWKQLGGSWYYLDPSTAVMATGWCKVGSSWYWMNGSGAMATGWKKLGGSWYYLNPSGAMATGWKQLGGSWYYLDPATGVAAVGSKSIGGKIYYFNSSCQMLTGWAKHADGSWSWHNASGAAATGWKQLGGSWYYLDPSTAVMATGWCKVGSSWYWMNGSGAMATGWKKLGGSWYYLNPSGAMATGWKQLGGSWYYLDLSSGAAATGERAIDGKFYYFNASNQMVVGWQKFSDGSWGYYGPDGSARLGWQVIGGKRYYFDSSNGHSLRGNQVIDGEKYYFGADSALQVGDIHQVEKTGVFFSSFSLDQQRINSGSGLVAAMTPSNYPKGSAGYYQFARLDLGYSGIVTADQINAFIESVENGRKGTLRGTGQHFIDAAKLYGVNEIYLLAHAIHETGWGTSNFAKGYQCNGKTYYSFFGIAAFDSNPNNTQNFAVKQGWDSIRNGITGGGKWIASNYIKNVTRNQNTLYKMRWNYPQYAKGGGVGYQYATDPQWAVKIASIMNSAYKYMGIPQDETGLIYLVPQYS